MNPITSPIARATARSSIIERNPIVRLGFWLITTRYWLPRPDRTLQRLFPDGNRFAGSLSFRRMTSSLPSTRPTVADQRWRRASRSRKCMRGAKTPRDDTGATLRAALGMSHPLTVRKRQESRTRTLQKEFLAPPESKIPIDRMP
jgi:hypothetical protein